MMVGTAGTGKLGKVYYYYKCGNAIYRKACDKKAVKKAWIERFVVSHTTNHVLRDDAIDKLSDAVVGLQKRENTVLPFLQKRLSELDKKIENILTAIEDGITSLFSRVRLSKQALCQVRIIHHPTFESPYRILAKKKENRHSVDYTDFPSYNFSYDRSEIAPCLCCLLKFTTQTKLTGYLSLKSAMLDPLPRISNTNVKPSRSWPAPKTYCPLWLALLPGIYI